MKPKDEVIKSIMEQVTISMSKSFQKIIDCCDPLLRQAYNEGYREADKHWESLKEDFGNQVKKAWQEGFDSGKKDFSMLNIEEALNFSGWLQAHDKDIAELEYKRGCDDGWVKCLQENCNIDCSACNNYQKGIDDAWNIIKKVIAYKGDELWAVFGTNSYDEIFNKTYEEVAQHIVFREDSPFDKNYSVGDEVIAEEGAASFVITFINDASGCVAGIDEQGGTYSYFLSELCYKTGRHFDVGSFLKQIEVNQEK